MVSEGVGSGVIHIFHNPYYFSAFTILHFQGVRNPRGFDEGGRSPAMTRVLSVAFNLTCPEHGHVGYLEYGNIDPVFLGEEGRIGAIGGPLPCPHPGHAGPCGQTLEWKLVAFLMPPQEPMNRVPM